MIKLYFQPLQEESFLSKTEVISLFGNIQDIYSFQQEFLQSLEEAVEQEGDLDSPTTSSQMKVRNIKVVGPPGRCGDVYRVVAQDSLEEICPKSQSPSTTESLEPGCSLLRQSWAVRAQQHLGGGAGEGLEA